jgi:hypothetical protein
VSHRHLDELNVGWYRFCVATVVIGHVGILLNGPDPRALEVSALTETA